MGFFNKKQAVEIEIGQDLFRTIWKIHDAGSMRGMLENDPRVPWDDNSKQAIDIKGESWFKEDLARLKGDRIGEVWYPGLLLPDTENASDPNAVALYLIDNNYLACKVGYLPSDIAKKVSKKISNLLVSGGQVVPVIAKILGGESGKPNFGVRAWVKTNLIKF